MIIPKSIIARRNSAEHSLNLIISIAFDILQQDWIDRDQEQEIIQALSDCKFTILGSFDARHCECMNQNFREM